jgi:beta-1,3-galactosyltransferase 1
MGTRFTLRALLIHYLKPSILTILIITLFKYAKSGLKIDTRYYINDYIINPHNFTYTFNPGKIVCNSENVNILIYIHSSPKNFRNRKFVRETWSSKILFPNIRTVFMMGLTHDSLVNDLLKHEFDEYHDIVQENFLDTHRNLTLKALMAFKWIKDYCSNVNYIVKLDEDTLMNTFALLEYIEELETRDFEREKMIMCYVWRKIEANLNNESKLLVLYDEVKKDAHLDYCVGAAYIFTSNLPALYFNLSQYANFFWVDNYYITGQIRALTDTTIIDIRSRFVMNASRSDEFYTLGNRIIFGHFTENVSDFYRIWHKILQMNHR